MCKIFVLNGQQVNIGQDINLLEYLRDYAWLTSVKNGCAEGACQACMVLFEGKATRACLLTTAKVSGKSVLTVETCQHWKRTSIAGLLLQREPFGTVSVSRVW